MNNEQIAFQLGQLTQAVKAQGLELHNVRVKVDALVNANALARGGKKMLYKVGAVCGTLGAGIATATELALKHLSV